LRPGEDPRTGAERELREETGYVSDAWQSLGRFAVDGNRGCGIAHLFLARGCRVVGEPDSGDFEEAELQLLTLAELARELSSGNVHELCTAAALGLAQMEISRHE
jgi:ADP-ribose pyrophosphatase